MFAGVDEQYKMSTCLTGAHTDLGRVDSENVFAALGMCVMRIYRMSEFKLCIRVCCGKTSEVIV